MAITKLNSLAIPAGTVEPADISYPLTNFSSTGIDDNATATAITIKNHSGGTGPTIGIGNTTATAYSGTSALHIGDSSGEGELYLNGQYQTVLQHTVDGGGGAGVSAQSLQMLLNDGSGNVTLDWRIDNTRSSYNKVIEHYRHVSDGTQDYTRFQTNTTERMRIDGNGKVGIGTSSPNQKLHVYENVLGVNIKLENNDGAYEIQKYSDDIYLNLVDTGDVIWRLGTALTERIRFKNDGSVGIGTNGPDAPLHVSGGINTGPATAGSTDAAFIVSNTDDGYGIHMNVSGSSGAGFISAQRNDGTATGYNLILQPNSGSVMIGTQSQSSLLDVGNNGSGIRNSINIGTNYPGDGTKTGKITWRDGANIVAQLDTSYDGTAVRMNISSLYQSGYNTADVMHIDPRGITKPKNPAFLARHSSNTATGKIPFNNEAYDVGSNFDTTNNRFTAPVAGYYFFYMHTLTTYAYNGDTRCVFRKNGVQYTGNRHITNKQNWDTSHATALIYCAANDYVEAWFDGLPTSGAAYSDSNYNGFFGFLVS